MPIAADKKSTRSEPAQTRDRQELGFAAFLDLRDSTYVWNQHPDLAQRAIVALGQAVNKHVRDWQGRIGNFTGDGFLLLFPVAEYAIRALASVIDEWEPIRTDFFRTLEKCGAYPPDETSLTLRTGIAHGHYRWLRLQSRSDVAGEAINRASRCEAASKAFLDTALLEGDFSPRQRVFVTQDVFGLIGNKTEFIYSEKLVVQFKGYERPSNHGLATTPDHLVAIWPKTSAPATRLPKAYARTLKQASERASKIDVADRLVAAAGQVAEASTPYKNSTHARPRRDTLLGAVMCYGEALEHFPDDEGAVAKAQIHCKLGLAQASLAELLPKERVYRLQDAFTSFSAALSEISQESDATLFATINSNISTIRLRQAELTGAPHRADYITQAIRAAREVLKVHDYTSDPMHHSAALSKLAAALAAQAELLSGDTKLHRCIEVVAALRQALAVTTAVASPEHFASLQSDLSEGLRVQAQLVGELAGESILREAEVLSRESVRALDADHWPLRYANAQVIFGRVLLDQAQKGPKAEAVIKLAEAKDAFKEALKGNELDSFPFKHAVIQEHLGAALQQQTIFLSGPDRELHVAEARNAFAAAVKGFTQAGRQELAARASLSLEACR